MRPTIYLLARSDLDILRQVDETLAAKRYALDREEYARSTGFGIDHYSVDMFLYNRCFVIANGNAFYERVLKQLSLMDKQMDFKSLFTQLKRWCGSRGLNFYTTQLRNLQQRSRVERHPMA
jgi:uncharacterized protein DUF4240